MRQVIKGLSAAVMFFFMAGCVLEVALLDFSNPWQGVAFAVVKFVLAFVTLGVSLISRKL